MARGEWVCLSAPDAPSPPDDRFGDAAKVAGYERAYQPNLYWINNFDTEFQAAWGNPCTTKKFDPEVRVAYEVFSHQQL